MTPEPNIEDLSPEPEPSHSWREWLLGAVLIAVILAAGVNGWWQGERASQAYRQGVGAEAQRHWALAGTAFRAADAWQDAPARATHAEAQDRQLDTRYTQGQAAVVHGDWPAAVRAFTDAAAIQPDYQDVTRQVAAAQQALRRSGLADTVQLVTEGAQPGLYLQPADRYLPGSDANSRVRAIASDGRHFIYDQAPAPSPGANAAKPTATPPTDFWIPSHGLAEVRLAVLVTLDAAGGPALVALPVVIDGRGLGLFLGDVLWWFAPRNDFGYYSYALTYYDWRTGAHELLAGPSGRQQPVAWQPDGSQVALAEYESVPPGADPRARLYLTDARGADRRYLGEVAGTIGAAAFSADGHYVFFQASGKRSTTHALYLADLRPPPGRRGPQLEGAIESLTMPNGVFGGLTATWLGARPDLLIDSWVGGDERLALYRPERIYSPEATYWGGAWTNLWHGPAHPDIPDLAAIAADGQTLAWRARPAAGADRLIVRSPGGQTREVPLTEGTNRSLELVFAPRSDYLVYGGYTLDGSAGGRLTPVFSLPVSGSGAPVQVGERVWDAQLPSLALPAAGTLVVFVNPQHELHAVTYDGRTDLLIARGVAAIWNLHAAPFSGWVH